MKQICLTIALLTIMYGSFAQSVDQALLFSQPHNNSSTARSTAMGGAFGALGGDFSTLSVNPAGIAIYRSSELSLTPSFIIDKQQNNGISETTNLFTISNIGYVTSFIPRLSSKNKWKNYNFGIGYNNIANFNSEYFIHNNNYTNSILDNWIGLAKGLKPKDLYPFEERLAYDNYLIGTISTSNTQYKSVLGLEDKMSQEKNKITKGYINEYILSFGANYSYKLYVGASIGIQDLFLKIRTYYSEFASERNESSLNKFTYGKFLKTNGIGINLKLGVIYKPTQSLRLGIALHTPTYYNLNYEKETFLDSYFDKTISNGFPADGKENHSYISEYIENANLKFRTPMRTIFSAAYIFNKRVALSVDYELINYSNSKYSDGEAVWNSSTDVYTFKKNFTSINNSINNTYQSTGNLRIGAEIRATSQLSIRAGYAYIGDAFKDNYNENYQIFSGGLGYRYNNFFVDASCQYTNYNEDLLFYANSDIMSLEKNNLNFKMTLGFRF